MTIRRWTKLGLACVAVAFLLPSTPGAIRRGPAAIPPSPVPVIAATVQQHDFPIVLTGLGTVRLYSIERFAQFCGGMQTYIAGMPAAGCLIEESGNTIDANCRFKDVEGEEMKIYRVEVVGPFPIGGGKEYWLVLVFDDEDTKIGQFEAYSEADALVIKDELMSGLALLRAASS
jgi:hypothetical protein